MSMSRRPSSESVRGSAVAASTFASIHGREARTASSVAAKAPRAMPRSMAAVVIVRAGRRWSVPRIRGTSGRRGTRDAQVGEHRTRRRWRAGRRRPSPPLHAAAASKQGEGEQFAAFIVDAEHRDPVRVGGAGGVELAAVDHVVVAVAQTRWRCRRRSAARLGERVAVRAPGLPGSGRRRSASGPRCRRGRVLDPRQKWFCGIWTSDGHGRGDPGDDLHQRAGGGAEAAVFGRDGDGPESGAGELVDDGGRQGARHVDLGAEGGEPVRKPGGGLQGSASEAMRRAGVRGRADGGRAARRAACGGAGWERRGSWRYSPPSSSEECRGFPMIGRRRTRPRPHA